MVVSNDEERIAKIRFWATQAREKARHYEHKELGYNYRMSNIVAGIGRGQLKVLDQRLAKKRYIFDYYRRELGKLPGVEFMPANEWDEPNRWLTCILLSEGVQPSDIMEALDKENIESRPIWKPMHLQPFYKDSDYITTENGISICDDIFSTGVCLPSDSKMTDDDLERVVGVVKDEMGASR